MKPEMINLYAVPVAIYVKGRAYNEAELSWVRSQLQNPVKAIANFSSPNKNVLDAQQSAAIWTMVQEHTNSVVSGVLYINVTKTGSINFFRNEDKLYYELTLRKQIITILIWLKCQ